MLYMRNKRTSGAQMLEVARADAESLAADVASTSQLSERVSSTVRELDSAQSHVRDTLAAIHVIVDRSNCIYGVR
jgi:conserved oligomeric Golgi complex subunit 4